MRRLPLLLLLVCLLVPSVVGAQTPPFDFTTRGPYAPGVPTPESVLGYSLGSRQTVYADMARVMDQIAAAAPARVRIVPYGRSAEGREQRLIVLSSPENLAKLEAVRSDLARLAEGRLPTATAAEIARRTPAVAWLNYSIHGDESAAFEAMMQVAYQLAASTEPATVEMLSGVVVLINASHNPDGHERFAVWANSVATGNPDPAALEHQQPWSIYGRFTHYRFDPNRDFLLGTQVETRNVQRAMLDWHPQLFVDHHGETTQFFFPPAALPVNSHLPRAATDRWLDTFGRANAAAFDAQRWHYYVRDVFDLHYAGYTDSWSSLTGATGMTYETDGGGKRGLLWRRDDETLLTFRSAIAKHYTASLATVATLAANREARLRDYAEFHRTALDPVAGAPRRLILLPGNDPTRALDLVRILLRSGIEVGRSRAPFTVRSATPLIPGDKSDGRFPAGAYVVDLEQGNGRMARALLELAAPVDEAFRKAELAKARRNGRRGTAQTEEDYGFYDITAWSLPALFGVETYTTAGDVPSVEHLPVESGWGVGPDSTAGRVIGGTARSAYLYRPDCIGASRLTYSLLANGFKVAVATRALAAGATRWPRGSIIVRVERNPDSLHTAIDRLSRAAGVNVTALNTAYADDGDTGPGGEAVVSLKRPRVAVLADDGVDMTSYGATWWTLETQLGVTDFTALPAAAIRGEEALERYNVLVVPSTGPGTLNRLLGGKDGAESLKGWVSRGGTLLLLKSAAAYASMKDVSLSTARVVGRGDDAKADTADAQPVPLSTEAEPPLVSPSSTARSVPIPVPGALFRATIDRSHFLTYGYEAPTLPLLMNSGTFLRPSREGGNVVVFGSGPTALSGFTWPDNTERLLADTSYLIDEPTGRGHVILFADDPNFRGLTRGATLLFANALLLSPTLR